MNKFGRCVDCNGGKIEHIKEYLTNSSTKSVELQIKMSIKSNCSDENQCHKLTSHSFH